MSAPTTVCPSWCAPHNHDDGNPVHTASPTVERGQLDDVDIEVSAQRGGSIGWVMLELRHRIPSMRTAVEAEAALLPSEAETLAVRLLVAAAVARGTVS